MATLAKTSTQTTTLDPEGVQLNAAVLAVIVCAAVGGIIALMFVIICASSKCSQLEERRRKEAALEVKDLNRKSLHCPEYL